MALYLFSILHIPLHNSQTILILHIFYRLIFGLLGQLVSHITMTDLLPNSMPVQSNPLLGLNLYMNLNPDIPVIGDMYNVKYR